MSRPVVLVSEEIAESGLARLRERYEVDVVEGATPEELRQRIRPAAALIVRSATKVDSQLIAAAPELRVIGRAGIGLDNVDLAAATRAGIMVVNAPQSNVLSAAEHTLALLLAQARNIPAADRALRAGKWARSHFQGVELHGKTLGIVGLGRVGALVAHRALAFGMRAVAFDPYVSRERARQLGIEMRDSVDDLLAEADFVTIHLPKTAETIGMIGRERLRLMKPSARLVNTARGGIVDEEALHEALRDGVIAGAALDVFDTEPTTESPLFELEQVVVTPHLGASTAEAQDKAGATIAEQVDLALRGELVPFAVNVAAGEVPEMLRPFLALAETLGRLFTAMAGSVPPVLEVSFQGMIADYDTRILTLAILRGLFSDVVLEPVTLVNAPLLAQERGVEVRETSSTQSTDYVNLVRLAGLPDGRPTSLGGTLVGKREAPKIVEIDGHSLECPPARNMLIVHNDDRPGMVGLLGTVLGNAGINITDLALHPHPDGSHALIALTVDRPAPAAVLEELRAAEGILEVRAIALDGELP